MSKPAPAIATFLLAVAASLLLAETPVRRAAARPAAAMQDGISVWFSPDGGCTEAVVAEVNGAKRTLDVQAYSFTSAPIAKAIADAQARGVKVRVVLDKGQRTEQYSSATFLHNQQVPVWIDAEHAIAHNKVMVVDGSTVITGSFNFTKAAEERNAENLLVIRGKQELAKAYLANFEQHLKHSQPYTGPAPKADATSSGALEGEETAPAPTPAVASAMVYVTKNGKRYHRAGCRFAEDGSGLALSAARVKGLTACASCKPG